MSKDKKKVRFPAIIQHGWDVLPHVVVDAYNEELKDKDGFLGDRASKGAFRDTLDKWRKQVAAKGMILSEIPLLIVSPSPSSTNTWRETIPPPLVSSILLWRSSPASLQL
jgi:hypothetical protein